MIYLRCAERLAVLSGFCGATAGRLTAGTRYAGSSTTGSASFTERGISYDKAGGMLAIQRYGSNASTPEDNLTLSYNGMKLASVTGTIGSLSVNAAFTYDACGRTLTDGVSKLNYQYNLLGALTAVADAGTLTPTTLSTYRHLADGTKYMTVSAGNNGALLYRGPLTFTIADVTATTPAISFLRAETGSTGAAIIASATGSGAAPYFYVTDQLGSVRAVVDGQGNVVERNDYYTYGKRHTTGRTYADLKNSPLLFSGKEDQGQALDIASGATTPSDLRILDFGARHYDPIVPRWTTPDPLAEKYFPINTYAYCAGDPVSFADPSGLYIEEGSIKRWNREKKSISNEYESLLTKRNKLYSKLLKKGINEKYEKTLKELNFRIDHLCETLNTMNSLESSSQGYSLNMITAGIGGLSYDETTDLISINYTNTAIFVHELTHAGQYETGDIAFSNNVIIAQDVTDELSAYYNQYAFDPSSVPNNPSIDSMNVDWLYTIEYENSYIYLPGGIMNTGIKKVSYDSSVDLFIESYPNTEWTNDHRSRGSMPYYLLHLMMTKKNLKYKHK